MRKRVKCPKCGHVFEVGVKATRLRCPECGHEFYVFTFSLYLPEVA